MKVLEWALVLLMAVLGLMAGAPALASAAAASRNGVPLALATGPTVRLVRVGRPGLPPCHSNT
jgi:hypothetical protein